MQCCNGFFTGFRTIFHGCIFDGIYAQELESKIDLSWCDPDTCKIYTAVTRKDIHGNDDLHETSGEITIDDISEQNHLSIFNWKN